MPDIIFFLNIQSLVNMSVRPIVALRNHSLPITTALGPRKLITSNVFILYTSGQVSDYPYVFAAGGEGLLKIN